MTQSCASLEQRDAVAVLRFSHPPVNTLAHPMRVAVFDKLNEALADADVKAVVVTGEGRGFCAGAQITEFNTPLISAHPTAHDLWAAIEAAQKYVVAAIHGYAMGGGLEFSMACHYRVAAPEAKIAAREVRLGLLPGAGGTQRLPRAVGVERALNMMLTGDVVLAKDLEGSLIDRCVRATHVVDDAVAFAHELIASRAPLRRLRDLPLWPASELIAAARKRAPASGSRYAPAVIVDCVETASGPFDEGLRYERERFQELVNNEESLRLRREFLDRTA